MSNDDRSRRLASVRTRLLAFDYSEEVGFDSLDLVEHLFNDLVSTTEIYQQLHDRENNLSQELGLLQTQLFSLRKDNSRLVRENNELHREIIAQGESSEAKLRHFEVENQKLKTNINEANFLRNQAESMLKAKEKESETLTAKLAAFSDAFDGIDDTEALLVESGNGRYTLNRPHMPRSKPEALMQINSPLSPSSMSTSSNRDSAATQQKLEVDQAKSVVEQLQGQVEATQERLKNILEDKERADKAIELRDIEIERLSRTLELGKDLTSLSAQNAHETNRKTIDQLNEQVDFLNKELARLTTEAEDVLVAKKEVELAKSNETKLNDQLGSLRKECSILQQEVNSAHMLAERKHQQVKELEMKLNDYPQPLSYGNVGDLKSSGGENYDDGNRENTIVHDNLSEDLSVELDTLTNKVSSLRKELGEAWARCDQEAEDARCARAEVAQLKQNLEETIQSTHSKREQDEEAKSMENNQILKHVSVHQASTMELLEACLNKEKQLLASTWAANQRAEEAMKESVECQQLEMKTKNALRLALQRNDEAETEIERLELELNKLKNQLLKSRQLNEVSAASNLDSEQVQRLLKEASDDLMDQFDKEKEAHQATQSILETTRSNLDKSIDEVTMLRTDLNKTKELLVAGSDMRKEELSITQNTHQEALERVKHELSMVVKERDDSSKEVCRLRIDHERSLSLTARSQAQAAASEDEVNRLKTVVAGLSHELEESNSEAERLSVGLRLAETMTQELKRKMVDDSDQSSDLMAQTVSELTSSLEQLKGENSNLTRTISESKKSMEDMLDEMAKLRSELSSSQERNKTTEGTLSLAKSSLMEAEQTIQRLSSELQLCETKSNSQHSKERYDMESLLSRSQQDNEALKAHVASLEHQLKQHKENSSRCEHEMKLNGQQLEKLGTEHQNAVKEMEKWKSEVYEQKQELNDILQRNTQLKDSITRIDAERDEAFEVADENAEVAAKATAQCDSLQAELEQLKEHLNREDEQADVLESTLLERDQQLRDTRGRASNIHQELLMTKALLSQRMEELRTACEDLKLMTEENQAAHTELTGLMTQKDRVTRSLREAEARAVTAEQKAHMVTAERSDILANYKKVLSELRAGEERLHELNRSRQALAQELNEKSTLLGEAQAKIAAMEVQAHRRVLDREALDRQCEALSSNHRLIKRRLEVSEDEAARLKAHLKAQADVDQSNRSELERWQRASAASSEDSSVLRVRLSILETERNQVASSLDQERKRCAELERLIEQARVKQAASERGLQEVLGRSSRIAANFTANQSSSGNSSDDFDPTPNSSTQSLPPHSPVLFASSRHQRGGGESVHVTPQAPPDRSPPPPPQTLSAVTALDPSAVQQQHFRGHSTPSNISSGGVSSSYGGGGPRFVIENSGANLDTSSISELTAGYNAALQEQEDRMSALQHRSERIPSESYSTSSHGSGNNNKNSE